jgi:outer membrane immunogenic protein
MSYRTLISAAAFAMLTAAPAMVAVPALAADMPLPVKAPAPPPILVYNWSGIYVGVHLGGAWDSANWFEDATLSGSGGIGPAGFHDAAVNSAGILGGGQAGFNYQTGWAVWGFQADGSGAGISGTAACFPEVVGTVQSCRTRVESLGTVTARVGAAFNNVLLYALAGGAWEHERLANPCNTCGPGGTANNSLFFGSPWGWTAGAGVEWAFSPQWSAFVQYNFMDFGRRDLTFSTAPVGRLPLFTENVREDLSVVKVGVNYRFPWGPMLSPRY